MISIVPRWVNQGPKNHERVPPECELSVAQHSPSLSLSLSVHVVTKYRPQKFTDLAEHSSEILSIQMNQAQHL